MTSTPASNIINIKHFLKHFYNFCISTSIVKKICRAKNLQKFATWLLVLFRLRSADCFGCFFTGYRYCKGFVFSPFLMKAYIDVSLMLMIILAYISPCNSKGKVRSSWLLKKTQIMLEALFQTLTIFFNYQCVCLLWNGPNKLHGTNNWISIQGHP